MLGRTLGGATVAVFQGLIVLIIAMLAGAQVTNWFMIPVALIFMFLIALLFTAVGTAIASLLEDMQGFQLIVNFFIMPLFFLSGALFPSDALPGIIGLLVRLNPLAYGVDGMREALTGTVAFGMGTDFLVLVIVTGFFLWLGSYFFSKIQL